MPFPDRWIQTWMATEWRPYFGPPFPGGADYYSFSSFWWAIDGPVIDMSSPPNFNAEITNWIVGNLDLSLFWLGGVNWMTSYVHSGGVTVQQSQQFAIPSPALPVLPMTKAVQLQRFSAIPGRRGRGRIFLAPVVQFLVSGNHLIDLGVDAWQPFCDAMILPVTAGSWTLIPSLVSYQNHSLEPIVEYRCVPELATLRRRRTPQPYPASGPPNFSVRPPP